MLTPLNYVNIVRGSFCWVVRITPLLSAILTCIRRILKTNERTARFDFDMDGTLADTERDGIESPLTAPLQPD